ncbi:efflux RND transporter permease subunit [Pseudobdellovibrio sp. HCB154]|uniref:efflux RND transporter permease subunit n=1 Tax=Pseudobdellovibrio sp. HCB154 TaxID=3386277 RepID=UPI003917670C
MSLAELSIKRPIFITCLVVLMLVVGFVSYKKMPVDQFPDVSFPVVSVQVIYPGASPVDIERQITKPIEDEVSSLPGLDTVTATNYDSMALIIIKFNLGTDIKDSEQQVRNRIANIRNKLPDDAEEPIIRRFDPADQPIISIAVNSEMDPAQLYDIANEQIKPQFERLPSVGLVSIVGGRKKEVQILVDKKKLQDRQLSMVQIAKRIEETSKDIPVGKFETSEKETVYRTVGEFADLKQLRDVSVNFLGSDRPVKLSEVAEVKESLAKAQRFSSVDGKNALFLLVYKQSGANTVEVADRVKAQIDQVNTFLKDKKINAEAQMVRDGSVPIRLNVADVQESIGLGILLCIIVVFFFLGSAKSTFITGLALPNSLLGGFVLMYAMGFSLNIMTLIALSLAVGLLIDDAIVVRENIFRHLEMGKDPKTAAIEGTKEVTMAVIATTLVVIAVFGPIAFVPGMIGQFFKQFGLTVVFTMIISIWDAFTVAPMLSAYMVNKHSHEKGDGFVDRMLKSFDRFQTKLEDIYESSLRWTLNNRIKVLVSAVVFFLVTTIAGGAMVKKTFLPAADTGEFTVSLEMPVGTSLEHTFSFAKILEAEIKSVPEVHLVSLTVGSVTLEANKADFYVALKDAKLRKGMSTTDVKEKVRALTEKHRSQANIAVGDYDIGGGGQKPLNLYLVSENLEELSTYAAALQKRIQAIPGLVDVDTNFRGGKPEYHVVFDRDRSEALGISTVTAGAELRYRTEGALPAVYRQNGIEYDVRLKFPDSEMNLEKEFRTTFVPNSNFNMVPLSRVAKGEEALGYSQINRQNKGRYIAITANLGPNGQLGTATTEIQKMLATDMKPPAGVEYRFEGMAKDFQELMANMLLAMGFGVLLIYLVLASLYESFVTPITILLALPLGISGAFVGLVVFDLSIDIFSMIGMILLMGVVAKNSILLVDYTNQLIEQGMAMNQALVKACRTRLRPILMTSLALIAGMLPIAIGVTALGSQRRSMGVAIICGVISSTILTLIVVPAAYGYIERFRKWSQKMARRIQGSEDEVHPAAATATYENKSSELVEASK